TGDLKHAALHAARALTFDPLRTEWRELLDEVFARAGDPLSVTPELKNGMDFAAGALRAAGLARAGRTAEALLALVSVHLAQPDVPFLAWAEEWLEAPGAAKKVDATKIAALLLPWVVEAARANELRVAGPMVEKLAVAHPDAIAVQILGT